MLKHRVTEQSNSLLETYDKNMAFFKSHMLPIYEAVKDLELTRTRLEIKPDGEIDLFLDNQSQYRGKGYQYAKNESEKFLNQFGEGAPLTTVSPPNTDMYSGGRFYFKHINSTCNKIHAEVQRQSNSYILRDYLPLTVVFGAGLGLHIQELLDNKSIHHMVVVEDDLEKFKASCYVTPWHDIVKKYNILNGKSFNFIIGSKKTPHDLFVLVWNHLVTLAPKFPLTSIIYNHRRDPEYNEVISLIHKEFHTFLTAWGNYDDEINQLNNGLHNLQKNTPFLPNNENANFTEAELNTPVLIVAGGPSLDERISWIKNVREKLFVVSAGSSLRSLKHYGIKPDLHIELESDFNTVTMFDFIGKEFTESIPVIAPIQISPLAMDYFKQRRLFFKDSSAQIDLFNKDRKLPIIPHATPTCSNTALATMLYYGFKNIYLIGLDLSYKDVKKTHAAGSIYFDDDAPEVVKHAVELKEKDGKISIKDMFGKDVLTDPIYYSVYKRVENCIREYKQRNIYNLSTGLNIEGSHYLKDENSFIGTLEGNSNKDIINKLFSKDSYVISKKETQDDLKSLYFYLEEMSRSCISIVNKMDNTIESFDKAAAIITYISEQQWSKGNYLYYFIRGTLWHYLYIGYSQAYCLTDEKKIEKAIAIWKEGFTDFMIEMVSYSKKITQRKLTMDDPWLYKSIYEVVD